MLHETIRNDNFSTTQGCNIVATLFRITFIAPTLQRCVALKIVCYTGDLSGRITLYSALCALVCEQQTDADASPVVASLPPKKGEEGEKRRPEIRLLFAGDVLAGKKSIYATPSLSSA